MAAANGNSGAFQPALAGTLGRAAMNTPSSDPNVRFLRETRLWANQLGVPCHSKLQVSVKDVETGQKVGMLMLFPGGPVEVASSSSYDPGDFDPSPLQIKILRHLTEGPKSPKQIRERTKGRMYDPRGIMELVEVGLVEKRTAKFQLTEPIGESFAAELTDEESQ